MGELTLWVCPECGRTTEGGTTPACCGVPSAPRHGLVGMIPFTEALPDVQSAVRERLLATVAEDPWSEDDYRKWLREHGYRLDEYRPSETCAEPLTWWESAASAGMKGGRQGCEVTRTDLRNLVHKAAEALGEPCPLGRHCTDPNCWTQQAAGEEGQQASEPAAPEPEPLPTDEEINEWNTDTCLAWIVITEDISEVFYDGVLPPWGYVDENCCDYWFNTPQDMARFVRDRRADAREKEAYHAE